MPSGTDANSVKWQFDWTYSKGFDQGAFDVAAGNVTTAEEAVSTPTAYQHMVTESPAVTITGLDEPDGIIYCNITRVTNGATDNADSIWMLTSDVHYRSTNSATLGKNPNPGFYVKG